MHKYLICLWLILITLTLPGGAGADDNLFSVLKPKLVARGFTPKQVDRVLSHPDLKFEAKTMAFMLSAKESQLNYKQFLSKRVVKKALKFKKTHQKELRANQRISGVEPEVVVALLAVETRLGAYMGSFRVVNALASQAVLDQKRAGDLMAPHWPQDRIKEIRSRKNKARFKKPAQWALNEFEAILRLAQKWKVSPYQLKGSPAGALGMCQFVPTSIQRWAKDGDKDGKINLYEPADAIHSVGNYLKHFGWGKGISAKKKLAVLLKYNQSTPYAKTILQLAGKLK